MWYICGGQAGLFCRELEKEDVVIGTQVLHYQILEKLGEGGMGVVYKARDTKLDRLVALKFLPQQMNSSEQGKARFIQEAKAASALNHPNVCTIHDIQEHEGQLFIVMELVDGQTLRDMLLTVGYRQAFDIGIQIAEGLAAAHDKGIVHRDIKPDNIMLRKDGIVQIMDFGLAKLRTSSSKVNRLTQEGSTVGTAGYMSPEQIQGLDSDHRSDIFSLGVVLYELFTRQLPFKGIHETALAYEIVNVDPAPMSAVNPEIEPGLDAIVLECMEKDPNERTQSAKQISVDLKRHKRESSRQKVSRITAARAIPKIGTAVGSDRTSPADGGQKAVRWLPWMIATIGLAGCAILAFMHFTERRPEVQSIHASILPPPGYTFNNSIGGHMALSPDGSMLAFVAADSVGGMSLFVRSLNSMMSRQLTESNGAQFPFWSPDSKFIGFFAQGKLKKVLASGAPPVTLCDAPSGRGGTWSQDGVILFSPNFDLIGIYRVAATGGVAVPVTHLDSTRNESNHRWPHFLPDGQHFFYTTQGSVRSAEYVGAMYVASLDGSMDKLLIKASSNMAYYNGYLLYIRQKSVVAQPLDLSKLELYGDAVPVVDKIEFSGDKSRGVFSVSANGVLTYQTPGANGGLSALYDAAGKKLLEIPDHLISNSGRFSPDGTKIVFDSPDPESNFSDIWQFDITRRINTRVTFDPSSEWLAIWSSDGGHVAYSSDKHGSGEIYVKNSDGSDAEHLIMKSPNINTTPLDWTPDGRQIIVGSLNESTNNDLVVISASGSDSIVTFANSKFNEDAARVSPDGRWLAYQSDESGRPEIYVRPFPTGNGKWQISDNGGTNPVWTGDGKTLFYNQSGGVVMAIAVTATSTTFFSGSGRKVLEISRSTVLDVSRDGKTFLVTTNVGGQTAQPISIATNWDKELSKK